MLNKKNIRNQRERLAKTINDAILDLGLTYQQFAGRTWEKLGYNTPSTLVNYLRCWTAGRRYGYNTEVGKEKYFTPAEKQKLSQLCKLLKINFNEI